MSYIQDKLDSKQVYEKELLQKIADRLLILNMWICLFGGAIIGLLLAIK
jgi:hypothetical protein